MYVSSSESENSLEDDDFTTSVPRSTQLLTTVDLNTAGPTAMGTDYSGSNFLPSLIRLVAS